MTPEITPADRALLCDVLGCSDRQRAQIMAGEKDDLPRVMGGLNAIVAFRLRCEGRARRAVQLRQFFPGMSEQEQ